MNFLGRLTIGLILALGTAGAALALTPLQVARYAPDISVELGGIAVTPQNIAVDDLAGNVALSSVGTYPNGTAIIAYDRLANGDQLLAFDIDTILAGGLAVRPGDVVRFNGTTYTLELSASAGGIPMGVKTDAVRWLGPGNLLLSFDVTVEFPSFVADDEDIVQINNGVPSLFFDGSAHGVPTELDIDAFDRIAANGNLLISFDGSGTIAGVDFDDEDVLEVAPASNTWALVYDGSTQHAQWPAADLAAFSANPSGGTGAGAPYILGGAPGPGGVGGSGGVASGSVRVFGVGTIHVAPGDTCISIYAVGANGVPDVPPGSIDDELLGTGGTDTDGNFVNTSGDLGIGLSRAVRPGEQLFAFDNCTNQVGAVIAASVATPALSGAALCIALLLLLGVAVRAMRTGVSTGSEGVAID